MAALCPTGGRPDSNPEKLPDGPQWRECSAKAPITFNSAKVMKIQGRLRRHPRLKSSSCWQHSGGSSAEKGHLLRHLLRPEWTMWWGCRAVLRVR